MKTKFLTLFNCLEFLAENEATVSLARNPDDPGKTRCVVRIGAELATVEYENAETFNVVSKFLGPVCAALEAKLEEGYNGGLIL